MGQSGQSIWTICTRYLANGVNYEQVSRIRVKQCCVRVVCVLVSMFMFDFASSQVRWPVSEAATIVCCDSVLRGFRPHGQLMRMLLPLNAG